MHKENMRIGTAVSAEVNPLRSLSVLCGSAVNSLLILLILFSSPLYSEDSYLLFLVEARNLNYECTDKLIRSIAKHPSDGSKNSDVGHAWIYLYDQGEVIEGGHSGETGEGQPKYLEGMFELAERGDLNPVRYLFTPQRNGFFQKGSGGHRPTFGVKVNITHKQAEEVKKFINLYPYSHYSFDQSCCTFLEHIAYLTGRELSSLKKIKIAPQWKGIVLWTDPKYSEITIASPDMLQKELKEWVKKGEAEEIRYSSKEPTLDKIKKGFNDLLLLPRRTLRWIQCW